MRATGASTVDEGDFTYSPRSCNLRRDAAGAGRATTGARTATTTAAATGVAATGERLTKLAGDRRFHGRRGGLHVLPEILQLAQDLLAADSELLGELVHAGLACHCTPC
ncbi:hypothetical protein BJF90_14805 [Pseudonocardia sp. CNS-004]|nr:hypothetical protein BJF90_14805 [Pseudonocardia sp. CNS-004]